MGVMAGLYPVRMMCMAVLDLLPRYVSYRYHWSFASATYLLSLEALGAAFCLLILLPVVSENLERSFELGAVQKNVVLARLSLGILSVSLLLEGLAPTIPTLICGLLVGTLGAGAPSALRALAGSLIDHKDTGKVFAGLAVAETLGRMAAYPTVAGLYNVGIGKGGGAWLGMPFDITGLVLGISTVVMCLLKFDTAPGS
jgi:MFS-type transporter involved in bile tolerance (Atg22 family)